MQNLAAISSQGPLMQNTLHICTKLLVSALSGTELHACTMILPFELALIKEFLESYFNQ